MSSDWKFGPGQRVVKTSGYPFPGVVEAAFSATQFDGTVVDRYVVNKLEIDLDGNERVTGLLHIFAPEQLAHAWEPEDLISARAEGAA